MLKAINNDEEPVIIADYKFDATRIGDYMGSFIEHWCFKRSAYFIRNFSIQYMEELMPMPSKDTHLYGEKVKLNTEKVINMGGWPLIPDDIKSHIESDGNAYFDKKDSYRFNVIPMFSLTNEKSKEKWKEWCNEIFFDSPQKCTDDTKFAEDMTLTYVEHDDVYQLSNDNTNYKFVSPSKNFANKSSTKNNFEHDYMYKILSRYDSDVYAHHEYGEGAGGQLNNMKSCVKKKNVNLSEKISAYKEASSKKGGHAGRSYGNGSVMRVGPNIFVAQGFKQGLELTKISVQNTHDCDYSIKSAQAVATVGFCANYGLRRETILKIIHFLYYDPRPLKTKADQAQIGNGRNCFLKCGNLDFCNFDMLSHREGKVSKNTTPQDLQLIDEEDAKNYIENNEFTEKCLPTAMLAIKICLTSKCAEEAMSKILRAAGDCDTIAATALPMIAALFGLPKKWVDRIYEISMCKDKTAAMNQMTNRPRTKGNTKDDNYQDNPKDIKVFDKDGYFIEHNEISRMANEKFKHHYREYAPIEWQLKNICELMEYLKDQEKNSKAKNKNQLLKEIFNDIKSDINFMLDKEQKYELEELSQDVKNTLENMQEITKEEIKDDKKLEQKLKQEYAKYKAEINKHRNATAKFQTKMRDQKLDNLKKENIVHIGEEIKPINSILKEYKLDEVSVSHLKAKEQTINKSVENNNLAQMQEKFNHTNGLESTTVVKSMPAPVEKQSSPNDPKNLDIISEKEKKLGNVTKKSTVSSDNKNAKEPTVVINNPQINQHDSQVLENKSNSNANENVHQTDKVNEMKQRLPIKQIETGSVQNQNNLLSQQIDKDGGQTNKDSHNDSKNDVSDNSGKQKIIPSQNEINHKPFMWSSVGLLVFDVLLFVFRSPLTSFPATIGTGGLVLLLFVWFYKASSSRSNQSVVGNINPKSEDGKQSLIQDSLTKTAEINGQVPSQAPLNDKSKIDV